MLSDTQPTQLVHPEIHSGHSFTNVLLVDSAVTDYQVFVEAASPSTFPIVYSSHSSKTELTTLLQAHFTNIERIAICFLGSAIDSNCCLFLDASPFFTKDDQDGVPSGENLGANVIPGKSPTTSCMPVSISSKYTLGKFLK